MKVLNIDILTSAHGTDKVVLQTDLPSGVWPYQCNASAIIEVAQGDGESYALAHFPGIPVKVIDVN